MNPNEKGYYSLSHAEFTALLQSRFSSKHVDLIEVAYSMAKYGHRNQVRADQVTRYFDHPKSVAMIALVELRVTNWRIPTLALLHDVREDTRLLSPLAVEKLFGKKVANSLAMLSKLPPGGYIDRLTKLGKKRELMVKLCDRLHNMRTLGVCDPDKQRRQIVETRDVFLYLATKLEHSLPDNLKWQAQYLHNQLEALCVQYEQALA